MRRSLGAIVLLSAATVPAVSTWASTGGGARSAATLGFIRNGEVGVVQLGSTGMKKLTHTSGNVSEIEWSPDGRTIAFVRLYDAQSQRDPTPSEIYVVGADGKGLRRLTMRLLDVQGLAWSPDGDLLAFRQRRKGVFVLGASGGRPRQLAGSLIVSTGTSWSMDGKQIAVSAFVRSVPAQSAVYVVPANGGTPRRVTRSGDDTMPVWSPSGGKILYQRNSCSVSCVADIHVLDVANGADRRLVRIDPSVGVESTWAPDGRTIAFYRRRKDGNFDIWTIAVDGSGLRRPATDVYGPALAWSRNGNQIAFVRNGSIFVMNPDGSEQRKVVADATAPAWQP